MTNALFLILSLSLMSVWAMADDRQNSGTKDASRFVRQLAHSVGKRSVGPAVLGGLDERYLDSRRYREEAEEARRHRAALLRQEQELRQEEEEAEDEGQEEVLAEGLDDDDDLDERDDDNDDNIMVEAQDDDLEDRMNAHGKAHATLKRIHTALKRKAASQKQAKALGGAKAAGLAKAQGGGPVGLHKRHNNCNIGGNSNSQWCHNSFG